jgi:DNA-binding XRE family transcriptional regulator
MIGLQLKTLRITCGISQKDFAKLYGATPQAIRNIENAKTLSTRIIQKYCDVLGFNFEIIFK